MRWLGTSRTTWLILVGVFVALGAFAAFRYARLYNEVREGRHSLVVAAELMEEKGLDISEEDLRRAEAGFMRAQEKLDGASRTLGSDPLVFVAAQLPWAGTQVGAGRDLVHMGSDGAAVGLEAVAAARTYREFRDAQGGPLSERVVPALEAVAPEVAAVEEQLASLRERRADISENALFGPLRPAVEQLDEHIQEVESRLADYRRARRLAPKLLGYEGPQTYLILAHDNTEILGTGGFILVYGFVTLDRGRVEDLFLDNVVNIHPDWPPTGGGYLDPPRPLATYLLRGWPMGLAEASWWPDFPSAASNAINIYRVNSGRDQPIDGVIGVNLLTLEELLRVLGPVTVPEYGVTVTHENVTETTLITTHPEGTRPWEHDRYDFVGYLAEDVIEETLSVEAERWSSLLDTLHTLGREKNLLFYHTDAAAQELITDFDWDGGIRPTEGDFLMVVDSSVASTKLNLVVEPSITLDVTLDPLGIASHEVTISYQNDHAAWAQTADPRLVRVVTGDGSLPVYANYVRLLVPPYASIWSVLEDGADVGLEDVWNENGRRVFGRFFTLPLDTEKDLTLTYSTPSVIDVAENPFTYRLLVQKQPGTRAIPLEVSVRPPPGWTIVSTELDGRELDGPPGEITTDLLMDREIIVRYEPAG